MALCLGPLERRTQLRGQDREQPGPAGDHDPAVDHALDPHPLPVGERLHARQRPPCRCGTRDGQADGVLARVLERPHETERLVGVDAVGRGGVDEGHPPGRDRAGLVEHDGVDPAGRLEDLRSFDEDAELRAAPGSDEDRGGGGEAQRARAGDDQDSDRGGDGAVGGRAREQPRRERDGGGGYHRRHEHERHPVGEPLRGRLAGLRVDDEACDLRQGRVGADAAGLDLEPAADVQRRAGHGVARADLDGHALPGDHGGVHRRPAGHDGAVRGDLLPGSDDEAHPDAQLLDGDPPFPGPVEDRHVLGAHGEERLERGAGPSLGTRLEDGARTGSA